jgi:hypothetical protein
MPLKDLFRGGADVSVEAVASRNRISSSAPSRAQTSVSAMLPAADF